VVVCFGVGDDLCGTTQGGVMKGIERWVIGMLLLTCVALSSVGVFQSRVIAEQRALILALVQAGAIPHAHLGGHRG